MDWILILIMLWLISAYLYRKSTFKPQSQDSKRLNDLIKSLTSFDTPIVNHKRPIDTSVNPFDKHWELAKLSKRKYNQFMSAQDKYQYLFSDTWYIKRLAVFERDNHTCQSCGSTSYLECHHIDYTYLGAEPMEHLTTLCRTCHTNLHIKLGYDRTTLYPIKDN